MTTFDAGIGGVPATELAATYGTPLVTIDLDVLDLDIHAFVNACAPRNIIIGYAAKAFFCVGFAEVLAATPLRVDVCSIGELLTAERGGLPAGRLYFHGCGKTDDELRAIAERRVAFDVIDGREELERLVALAPGAGDPPLDVMLRINTGIEAHTHEMIRTGGENTKFGIPLADVDGVLARLTELPGLRLIGLHAHLGSQLADTAPYLASLTELIQLADRARTHGHPVAELICGGGIGVETGPDEARPLHPETLAAALAAAAAGTPYRLALEPGRAIVARAGTTLYRVVAVKRQGARRFVILDGGMADNPRPALYDALHPARYVAGGARGPHVPVTLAGRSCENDELGDAVLPDDLAAGDLVALTHTGAYTYSMASNYNRFGRPPVVFVRDGSHRRVVRGERADDVLRNDVV